MGNDEVKKEFIKRYEFIEKNIEFILKYHIEVNNGKVNYDIPEYILKELESFLLGDVKMEDSSFYEHVEVCKKSAIYVNLIGMNNSILSSEKYKKQLKFLPNVYQIVRNYVLGQSDNLENKEKKILALDEYFRFRRYNNSSRVSKSGAFLLHEEIGDYIVRLCNEDKPYNRHIESLHNGFFINYVANKDNHYDDNNSIFTEKEKQEVYLKFHPNELPWDMKLVCKDTIDDNNPCNSTFNIIEENIFTYDGSEFYYMCPKCGSIIKINENILPTIIKSNIIDRAIADKSLYDAWIAYANLYKRDKNIASNKIMKRTFIINARNLFY